MRKGQGTYRLPAGWKPDQPEALEHLNRILVEVQQRLDTVQQIGTTAPAAPTGLAATGKQGVIWLTWSRIANVDGYIVLTATDSAMSQLVQRNNLPDSESCVFQLPVGNRVVTRYFTVSAYRGNKMSPPSPIVSGTSVALSTATETADPPTPTIAPRHPRRVIPRNGMTIA